MELKGLSLPRLEDKPLRPQQREEIPRLSLPKLEQDGRPRQRRQDRKTEEAHYMMQTPDGETLSVRESELSAFLRMYGKEAGADSTDS